MEQAEKGQFEYEKNTERQNLINPNFVNEYDNWDGVNDEIHFNIGTTSKALQSIGVDPREIYWDSSKIKTIKKDHSNITDDVIKQVPNILEEPVLIMQSKKSDSRLTLYGEVYDIYNRPVLAVLELKPTDKSGYSLEYMKIASTYSKTGTESRTARENAQKLINDSEILYIDSDKKRTDEWLRINRLSLPLLVTNIGSDKTISQNTAKVNTEIGTNLGKLLQEAQENTKFSISDKNNTELTAAEKEALAERKALTDEIARYSKEIETAYRKLKQMDAANEALGEVIGERRAERALQAARKEENEKNKAKASEAKAEERAYKKEYEAAEKEVRLGERICDIRERRAEQRAIKEAKEERKIQKAIRQEEIIDEEQAGNGLFFNAKNQQLDIINDSNPPNDNYHMDKKC